MAPDLQRMINIPLGSEVIRFDEDELTTKVLKKFRKDIEQVQKDYDAKIDADKVQLNILNEKLHQDLVKKEAEDEEKFAKRSEKLIKDYNGKVEALFPEDNDYFVMDLAFRCLKVIGAMVGQEMKVTPENFDNAPWTKVKSILARFLVTHGCPMGALFLPPRLSDQS